MNETRSQTSHTGAESQTGQGPQRAQRIVNPQGRLLTIKQAADYSGLTVWQVRERIWAGDLPCVQFAGGRKQYIDRKDLDLLIDRNKRIIQ